VAGDILHGAAIRKARGEDAKTATPAQDAWKQELQTKLGASLSRVDPHNPRNAWVLDLSGYNERGKAQKEAGALPPVATSFDAAQRARRLAPASPTEGVSP